MGLTNFLKESFDKAKGLAAAGVTAAALTVGMGEANNAEAAPIQLYFAGTIDTVPASFAGSGLQVGDSWSFAGISNEQKDYSPGIGSGTYLLEDVTIEVGPDIILDFSISSLQAGGSIGVASGSSWLTSIEGNLMGNVFNGGSLAFLDPSPAYDPDSLTSVLDTLIHGSFSRQGFVVDFVGGGSDAIYGTVHTIDISPVPVPEPSSLALVAAGAATGALALRRRREGAAAPTHEL